MASIFIQYMCRNNFCPIEHQVLSPFCLCTQIHKPRCLLICLSQRIVLLKCRLYMNLLHWREAMLHYILTLS